MAKELSALANALAETAGTAVSPDLAAAAEPVLRAVLDAGNAVAMVCLLCLLCHIQTIEQLEFALQWTEVLLIPESARVRLRGCDILFFFFWIRCPKDRQAAREQHVSAQRILFFRA